MPTNPVLGVGGNGCHGTAPPLGVPSRPAPPRAAGAPLASRSPHPRPHRGREAAAGRGKGGGGPLRGHRIPVSFCIGYLCNIK